MRVLALFFCLLFISSVGFAQDNYEIQTYESPTVGRGYSNFELHTNCSFAGSTDSKNGTVPTHLAWRNTLELTYGITNNIETGFYIFTNYTPGYGFKWVGNHLRFRFTAPAKWKIPVGLSLSVEAGYQRQQYSEDTWSLEIRPIIDKSFGKVYVGFNPVLGIALKSRFNSHYPTLEPCFKISAPVNKILNAGIEYYGSTGTLDKPEKPAQQEQQIYLVSDWEFNPDWELSTGIGLGLTNTADALIFKVIIGRRVNWAAIAKRPH
jgi:hypothetical protein